ncbi:MAG: hypothetical protein IJ801_05670 [Lachnospiraceae bacterium]|nr:hypothetical protein [Lachnospiraceae bacterium]
MDLFKKYITMFRQDMRQVMSTRCGLDELNNLLMLIGFLNIVAAMMTHKWILTLLGAAFVVLCYVRVFSKDLVRRKKENELYMRYLGGVVRTVQLYELRLKMKLRTMKDKQYAYFVCGSCGQVIRIPKGKGKVSIRCPKCSQTFVHKT